MGNQYVENSISHIDIGRVCGVYLLKDTITGNTYVGCSSDIRMRLAQHFFEMKHYDKYITTYHNFSVTYAKHGSKVFTVTVLEECVKEDLLSKEKIWIAKLNPTENTQKTVDNRLKYSKQEREMRSERTKNLWADPVYRERATKARLGNAYNKGYKCTEKQILNRKKAARISNMKRNYGEKWKEEYATRYPDFIEDLNGY